MKTRGLDIENNGRQSVCPWRRSKRGQGIKKEKKSAAASCSREEKMRTIERKGQAHDEADSQPDGRTAGQDPQWVLQWGERERGGQIPGESFPLRKCATITQEEEEVRDNTPLFLLSFVQLAGW